MLTDIELKTITDEELMHELKRGRQEALTYLFDRYYRLVFSIALKILRDRGEAEDLMQDVFIEIYKKIKLFNPDKGSAKTWILQYAYHRSLNRKKYLALRHFYDDPEDSALNQHEYFYSLNDWNGISYEDWSQTIKKGLKTLSDREQKVLNLVFFQGFLLKEVADQLNEPLSNVRNHYYRSLKKLRIFLQGHTCLRKKMA
jgi:RNA polymerase sigma-70 factor (ECF subfamily)